jgi:LEA14-like dessication related protein
MLFIFYYVSEGSYILRSLQKFCFALMVLFTLSSCANMPFQLEEPDIKVNSFKMIPSNDMSPSFEIGLHVANPNNIDIKIQGLSYTAKIDGNKVFSGVTNKLPTIPAYGSEDIKLNAQADLIGGLSLLMGLLKPKDKTMLYTLEVKISIDNVLFPIYVTREGELTLPAAGSN